MRLSTSAMLLLGVMVFASITNGPAAAASFTIVSGTTEETPQMLFDPGDVGVVEAGAAIDVSAYGITPAAIAGNGHDLAVRNAGSVSGTFTGIQISGEHNSVVNSGSVLGSELGINVSGAGSTVVNSGTIYGSLVGLMALGSDHMIINDGTVQGGLAGIFSVGGDNAVLNRGKATGVDVGLIVIGNSYDVTNQGTLDGGRIGLVALGDGNTIINSGTLSGSQAAVALEGQSNRLSLLAGSRIKGKLMMGDTSNTLSIGDGLNTVLTYEGGSLGRIDGPYVTAAGRLAVVDAAGFGAADEMLTDLTRLLANAVDGRLSAARQSDAAFARKAACAGVQGMQIVPVTDARVAAQRSVWAAGLGNSRGQGGDDGFDSLLGGLVIGLDTALPEGGSLGGFAGTAASRLDMKNDIQDIDATSWFGGVYAGFTHEQAFLHLALSGGVTREESDRTVIDNMVASGIEHARADYDGVFVSPSATVGTDMVVPGGVFTPSLRLRYAGLFLDSYEESGSAADLSVKDRSVHVFDARGQLAFAPFAYDTASGSLSAVLRAGVDASTASGGDVEAELLGQALRFTASNDDSSLRGFAGADVAYETDAGLRFFAGGEAGYGSGDSVTAEATAGIAFKL